MLTYDATSTSSDNYSSPPIGGMSFSNGGYCQATFRVGNGSVTQILYSGGKNATRAPDADCARIVRSCIEHLQQTASAVPRAEQARPGVHAEGSLNGRQGKLAEQYPALGPFIERGIAVSIDGVIYRDTWSKELPKRAEIFLLPRLAGG